MMGDNLMKERFKENKWMFAGGVVIVVAILTPLILILVRNHLDKKTFEALGPVGDFWRNNCWPLNVGKHVICYCQYFNAKKAT